MANITVQQIFSDSCTSELFIFFFGFSWGLKTFVYRNTVLRFYAMISSFQEKERDLEWKPYSTSQEKSNIYKFIIWLLFLDSVCDVQCSYHQKFVARCIRMAHNHTLTHLQCIEWATKLMDFQFERHFHRGSVD